MSNYSEKINKKFNIKKILVIVLIILFLILTTVITTFVLGQPYDKTRNTYTEVTINEGDNTDDIARKLVDAKIIENESTFTGLSAFLLKNGKYRPGTYLLSPCMNFSQISATLINGISTTSGFTIPAGYTVSQTFDALVQEGIVTRKDLDEVLAEVDFSNFDFIDPSISREEQLEGFLYPDTYEFDGDANALMILTTMLDNFDNKFTDIYRARADELGLTTKDIIIIASMIEQATVIDKEKPAISAVIYNRINLGIPLKNGYPDVPLCSPGEESIKAALYPENSDNIYYILSDKMDGSHEFASTPEEYRELLNAYRKAKKQDKGKQ